MLRTAVLTLLGLGLLLHLYTALMTSDQINAFSLGLMIWSWAPYLLIWVTTIRQSKHLRAFVPILFIFTADSLVHLAVFYSPQSSTASLGLLWAPLWNLILLVPLGMILGIGVERYFLSDEH